MKRIKNNISHQELKDFLGPATTDGLLALNELNLPPDSLVLDVGTGVGISAIFLALNGCKVLTGEPETDASIYAKMDWETNAERFGVKDFISFQSFDAAEMPFDDNSFDAVVFFGTLHHIDEKMRKSSVENSFKVCKNSGFVIFFEPNEQTIVKIRKKFPEHPLAANPIQYLKGETRSKKIKGEMMGIFIIET